MKKLYALGFSLFMLSTISVLGRAGGGGEGGSHNPDNITSDQVLLPWLTGPLLAPSGHVIPMGHLNFESYFYWTKYSGSYDSHWNYQKAPHVFWSGTSQLSLQLGVLPAVEFDVTPQFYYNKTQGEHMWRVGDLPITLAFQLLDNSHDQRIPCLKLRFDASIPIGKYQRLNPNKFLTDQGGYGSWYPAIGLVSSHMFQFGTHFLAIRYFAQFVTTAATHVTGFNAYGGDDNTHGTIYPGVTALGIVGAEYSLSQNWVIACDIQYVHQNKTRFSGTSPTAVMTSPSSENWSIAPAIEYNFTPAIGVIGGAWVTFAGRNSSQYLNWVFAINVYH